MIHWKNGAVSYQAESADLKTCTQAQAVTGEEMVLPTENIPDGAEVSQVFEVTEEEYTKVVNKLGVVTNTGAEKVERTLEAGSETDTETLLPKTVTLNYSDGSTQDMNVTWDKQQLADLSTEKAGTYEITGTVQQVQYENPFIEQRADPCILKGNDGYYYFTASYPMLGSSDKNGYDKVVLRRAKTIEGLKDAEEVTIWDCDDTTGMYRYIWAPEIRLIAGNYYIYYTASTQANNVWGIRPHVLKCTNPEDIMNPASWEEKGRFRAAAGDTKAFSAFSLDMTYFENNGHHYAIWAQTDECSCLFMAEIDPEEPWKCISQSVRLSYPEYSWERVQENVNEGPSVLKKNGKIYVAYSASGTGSEYTMGLLSADENADLLDVNVWTKQAYPALTSADVPGEYGPGHNSFTVDENGNDIFVYHARSEKCYLRQCAWANQGSLYDPCRDARLKRVHYAADGTPILKMTYAQELADEFKTVTAKVTVKAKEEPKPDTDESIVQAAKEELKLENADPVIGNLTLPTEIKGASISWKSSDPSIISDQAQKNENYADTPAGVVVRGSEDKKVTLTATITYGKASATKSFPLTVKKKADQKEYAAYLYIHFNEIKVGTSLQQIYFGVSKDGLQWTALNDNQPILESTVGDKGVRDPYIIRSAEGDKFYLIGTDLDIHHSRYGGSWAQMATIGSQSLVIWESEDLVNWSESRLADVGSKINAGCTWAPEAIYDEKTGEYLVFWASPLTKLTGDCNKKYIFVSKTRDFVNFTDPELYSDASLNIIDADLYKEGNKYYRLLKNSDKGYVYLQSASQLLDYSGTNISTIGGQQFVNRGMHFSKIDNTAAGCLETYTGRYEGPTMFKFNDRDEWCILVDEYGTSDARGYIPFLTGNLDEPNSVKLAANNTYTMTDGAKHGTVIPITQEEYDALIEKWGVTNKKYKEEQKDPILTYDFEETTEGNVIEDQAQDNDGTLAGNAVYRYDEEKQSNVLYLDGTTGTYAQLPDGLFDGLDNMTVTMDIKPESTQSFHFDFTVGQDNSRYLFLRIRDNEIRTSITSRGNGQERSAISSGSSLLNKWMKVTLVMENHKMTLYIDGEKAAEQKGVGVRNISELGSNLISYLGKSFYNDPYFKGSYDNVKVYNRALSEEEITDEYAQEKIRESAKALGITEGKTVKDLTLPTSGTNGTTITWKSDKPEYISETGKVTRPRAGAGNQKVTLTATISIGTVSQEYTYNMIVPEDTDAENKAYLEEFTEKFAPEWKYLWEDTKLPAQYKGMELTWKTDSPYISIKNGTEAVLAQPKPGEGEKEATLTAVFKLGNTTVEKEVKVIVEESIYGYVLSYVVSQEPDMQTEGISGKDNARTDVLHLALSTDGTSYTALNKEKGIFYPVDNKQLGSPSLFKKPDGTFGLIASADNANNKVMIYDSEDMIYYGNERVVTLTASGIVKNPEAVYDASVEAYHVYWEDADGQAWEVQTKDFTAFTDPVQAAHSRKEVTAEVPRYAKEYTALGLTKGEYQKLEKKYGNLHNTGVQKPADIEIKKGETFTLPEKLTLDYSDGSNADMKVTWNTDNVDTDKAGTYEVTGTIEQTKYNDPLVEMRADPYMIYNEEDGYYYFIGSYPTMNDAEDNKRIGYDRLAIRRSKDINGLTNAEEVEVWHDGWKADAQGYHTEGDGTAYYRYFWAPEIHKIGGKWRIITYASLNRNSKWGQMAIFTCEGKDMMDPSVWRAEGVVGKTTDGQTLGGFDTTFMEVNGQCYYVTPKNGKIWITTFDPENVLQPTGPLVQLSGANMAWEYNLKTKQGIDEGPAILQHDGKIFVCYSGATVDQHYCVGMIYADANSDLMNPASWIKYPYPLLTTSDIFQSKNQYGPGHNSFSIDANGNPVIVYHARTWGETIDGAQNDGGLNDPGRHARINSVHFAADGMPVLNMTEEELLAEEYKTVTVKITVTEKQTETETETETDKPEPTPPETETDKPEPTPPETETDKPEPTPPETEKPQTPSNELKKGDVVVGEGAYGVYEYRITGKNTAEILRVTKKGKKKATLKIFKTAKLGGKKYKITSVAANALKGNKKVKTLTIEKNIMKIGKNAFANCKNLKRIVIRSTKLKSVGTKAFKGISKKAIVKVPRSKKKSYTKLLQKRGLPKNVKIK